MCKCISNELHIHTQTFEYIYKYLDEQQKKEEGGVHVNIHICSTIIFIVLMPFVKTRNDISATNVMKLYTDTHTHIHTNPYTIRTTHKHTKANITLILSNTPCTTGWGTTKGPVGERLRIVKGLPKWILYSV